MKRGVERLVTPFLEFVRSGSIGGVLLVAVAVFAFAWANSPWGETYEALKEMKVGLRAGGWGLEKALILWVNDGLMAVFFLLVGLEIKREVLVGELSDRRAATLPVVAAVGGMALPALLYLAIAGGTDAARGWGIPMATDIAFALGVLSLLGDRVPVGLKMFLTALAIIDDLGAILVIALFYTEHVGLAKLGIALGVWAVALGYGALGGRRLTVFAVLGVVMWYFMLKSGIHATIAGVLLALAVPIRSAIDHGQMKEDLDRLVASGNLEEREVLAGELENLVELVQSPLHRLEHLLHPVVAFGVMPVFALFNAGFALGAGASLTATVSLGALVGLLVGKPLGVVGASLVAVKAGVASLPRGVGWTNLTGAGVLAGIGFTMALFVAGLAFPDTLRLDQAKLGVLTASVLSALVGAALVAAGARATVVTTEEAP